MKTVNLSALLTAVAIVTVAAFCIGCASTEAPQTAEQAVETPSQTTEEEPVFTRADPGAWEGKESGHLPVITYEKAGAGLQVTVTVNHVMNAEAPHYIMWIKLLDGDGNLLGQKEFQATDEKAVATFELSSTPSKLVAQEKCNVHGIWKEEVAVS